MEDSPQPDLRHITWVTLEVGPVLGEAESHELPAGGLRNASWRWSGIRSAARDHRSVATLVALVGLAVASAVLRAFIVGWIHGPFMFMDELGYERMALSFAHTGHFSLFGKAGLAYSPLYPIVISPVYALTSSAQTAYEWVKVENSLLLSLSVFPIYGIARSVLSRGRALGVAALSLVAPLMLYTGFELSENLAYPLCLVALWTMLRGLRRPSIANDALLLAAIVLASAARLQLIVLLPSALTAVLLVALLQPERADGRLRSVWRAMSAHRLLFGVSVAGLVAVLARTATNGGNLPLAGRYSSVGTAHPSALRVFEIFVHHLAELDWAVGVIPFAAALLAGYALVRSGFPRNALVFASVAVASTVWILLEVAFDAAAYDLASNKAPAHRSLFDLPRIHERYLIYLIPFFLVALFAAISPRRKLPTKRYVAIAATAALLPALIPFSNVINGTVPMESFALQIFSGSKAGVTVPGPHATSLILVLSAILAFVFVLACSGQRPSLAVFITTVVLLGLSAPELGSLLTPIARRDTGLPAHSDWVDRVVGSRGNVSVIGGAGVHRAALRETAYWNESIARVYYTCSPGFGPDFGEAQLTGGIHTHYAVVPAKFDVPGRVLAQDRIGKLVLVAPKGGVLRIPPRACAG